LTLRAPFPWFGGKSKVVDEVWPRLGNPPNYVEPFAGSLAMLLGRPDWEGKLETVNDKDGFICNVWRAIALDPESVTHWADWPINENDLHARHHYLHVRRSELVERLEGDPEYFDPMIAGWWLWGIASWIGSGWCYCNGPWRVSEGRLLKMEKSGGIKRQLPSLGNRGQGINRQLPHLGDSGQGINRASSDSLLDYMQELSNRLRRVRVCSGDWKRVCGPTPTSHNGMTGMFLDPPYAHDDRCTDVYAEGEDDANLFHEVVDYCLENGSNPLLRICLCGYDGPWTQRLEAKGWETVAWKASGGYSGQSKSGNDNPNRERLWFSPACLKSDAEQYTLF